MDNYVITIARGFGTGGKVIASTLAKDLGIHCYENRILTMASQLSGFDESEFVEVDEKLRGSLFSKRMAALPRTILPKPVENKFYADDNLFHDQAEIIRGLAASESCVIVGKCADFILKDYPNVISVYIEAPRAYCVERITKRMGVTEKEAHKLIAKTDKYRADYYKYYTHGNYWTNPVNYDITLNSERLGTEKCVSIIKDVLQEKLNVFC